MLEIRHCKLRSLASQQITFRNILQYTAGCKYGIFNTTVLSRSVLVFPDRYYELFCPKVFRDTAVPVKSMNYVNYTHVIIKKKDWKTIWYVRKRQPIWSSGVFLWNKRTGVIVNIMFLKNILFLETIRLVNQCEKPIRND